MKETKKAINLAYFDSILWFSAVYSNIGQSVVPPLWFIISETFAIPFCFGTFCHAEKEHILSKHEHFCHRATR